MQNKIASLSLLYNRNKIENMKLIRKIVEALGKQPSQTMSKRRDSTKIIKRMNPGTFFT